MTIDPETTANLKLPYLMSAQSQKHVTHNEALRMLDTLVQPAVLDKDLAAPPADPAEGDRYIVAVGATGDWAGRDGHLAAFMDGIWFFFAPRAGWLSYVADEGRLYAHDGTGWIDAVTGLVTELENLTALGVGTAADETNPFAAKLNAALWAARYAAEGGTGDLRCTLNKEAAANTLSLLFQTGWSGRAELGLTGSDDFTLKLSGDGASWTEVMRVGKPVGDPRADGNTYFPVHVGIGRAAPADYWSVGGKALWLYGGYFGINGGSGLGLWWNGYRNAAGGWTSFNLSGSASAGGVEMQDGGVFLRHESPVTGVSPAVRFQVNSAECSPGADNLLNSGSASLRWKQVFAATGTISTSDAREKEVLAAPDEAELRAARRILGQVIKYRRLDAVSQKGRAARLHVGVTAQAVEAAFEAEGLDPRRYALFCEDEIAASAQDGAAGGTEERATGATRLGLRYDQLMMFCLAALAG